MDIGVDCFHGGYWEGETYVSGNVVRCVIPSNSSFVGMRDLITNAIRGDGPQSECVLLWARLSNSTSAHYQQMLEDKDAQWFLTLVANKLLASYAVVADQSSPPSGHCQDGYSGGTTEHDSSINYADDSLAICMANTDNAVDNYRFLTNSRYTDMDTTLCIELNDKFSNKVEFKKYLQYYAVRSSFQFRTTRSCSSRFEARCVNEGCAWKVYAAKEKGLEIWSVRTINHEHSCSSIINTKDHRQANPFFISEYLRGFFAHNSVDGMKPTEIIRHMRFNHGVHISYLKAWRAREMIFDSIHGSAMDSYERIPLFKLVMEERNPGTKVDYTVDANNRFKYLFMAMHVSIQGWRYCRPVLSVDGTFLKSKYGGVLLIASGLDGNSQIFPIAFAVVDSENDESWCYFFEMLKKTFTLDGEFSIISDRHKSIFNAASVVFPQAHHGICMYHLASNLMTKFKNKSLAQLFIRCAKSYNIGECQRFLSIIDGMTPGVKQYLMEVGLQKWSRAHFRGMRYNIMTTNTSESFNARIRDARKLPILPLLMEIRNIMQQWVYDRRYAASAMATTLTTWADKQLRDELVRGTHYLVKCVDVSVYEVMEGTCSHIVNINKRSCSCRKWQIEQIPCSHVCAALKNVNTTPVKYTSHYYTKESLLAIYGHPVYPIGASNEWALPVGTSSSQILPPDVKRPAGRPRVRRFINFTERCQTVKCGRCGARGHNRKSCRNAIPIGTRK